MRRFRGRSRRRSCLGCGGLVLVALVILIVVGALTNTGTTTTTTNNVFGNQMTQRKYLAAKMGHDESLVLGKIGNVGSPENLAKPTIVKVFPSHGDNRTCNYWQITDLKGTVARLCFSDPQGRLVQKLERHVTLSS